MVNIVIAQGQGITQAIASNLGLSNLDCKKIKLSTWTQVAGLVNKNNELNKINGQENIFTGGNNINNISNKDSWKTDFKVQPNQKMIFNEEIWSKIKALLTGGKVEKQQIVHEQDLTTPKADDSILLKAPEKAKPVIVMTKSESPKNTQSTSNLEQSEEVLLVKQGEEINKIFKAMSNPEDVDLINEDVELQITDDDWRTLAGKKDKTNAEKYLLDSQYKTNIKNLGKAYITFIDKTFGNGDGVLSQAEYSAFESADMPDDLKGDSEAEQLSKNAFQHLDLNKDKQIDNEEMSAYFHAIDFGTEEGKSNGLNGKISAYDFMVNSLALGKAEKSMLDQKLAYTYKALFDKKPVE